MKVHLIFLSFLIIQNLSSYAGIMSGNSLNFSVGKEYLADGQMTASQEINLTCGQLFKGQGYMKAPTINIKTKKFEYIGTIECNGICTITVQEPFDQTQFTRMGNGQFNIIIDENLDLEKNDFDFAMPAINPSPIMSCNIFERPVTTSTFVPERSIKKGNLTFTFKGEDMLVLVDAIEKNDVPLVKTLLNDNSHIKQDVEQLTIVMLLAGLDGNLDIAKECINLGANINGKDCKYGSGTSHLITAVLNNKEFAQLLIASGVRVNETDPQWRTALHYAANNGYTDIVNALIETDINVDATDQHWRTALMYAADKGHIKVVKALLNAGADKDKRDKDGLKAINYVNSSEHKELFDLLNEKKRSILTQTVKENNLQEYSKHTIETSQSFFKQPISYLRIGQAAFLGTILACVLYKDVKRALTTWF